MNSTAPKRTFTADEFFRLAELGFFVWALLAVALKTGQPLVIVMTSSVLALLFLLSLFPDALNVLKVEARGRQPRSNP